MQDLYADKQTANIVRYVMTVKLNRNKTFTKTSILIGHIMYTVIFKKYGAQTF